MAEKWANFAAKCAGYLCVKCALKARGERLFVAGLWVSFLPIVWPVSRLFVARSGLVVLPEASVCGGKVGKLCGEVCRLLVREVLRSVVAARVCLAFLGNRGFTYGLCQP